MIKGVIVVKNKGSSKNGSLLPVETTLICFLGSGLLPIARFMASRSRRFLSVFLKAKLQQTFVEGLTAKNLLTKFSTSYLVR